jgi:hypothetical protein
MRKKLRFLYFTFIFHLSSFIFFSSSAQEYQFPLNRDLNTRVESFYEADTSGFHSSSKPFTMAELRKAAPVDSVFAPQIHETKFTKTWVGRKLFKEHFIDVNNDDIHLSIDPVFNFQGGRDLSAKENGYVNSRGVLVQGDVKQKFFFYTGFRENGARYVNYVSDFVSSTNVAPGQGRVKFLGDHTYDFSYAYGGIAYTLNRHFDFSLASDKNFIGDGYRSLLLSDNSTNYPFLKINMTFWKFKYTVIYSVMQDSITNADTESGFRKKIGRFSYLDLNIGRKNKLSVGIFEALISKRSFDFNYANPVLFLRPVEYSVGSPDNELIGLNVKYKINTRNLVYGQLLLDEFLLSEVRSGNGWWANKQAFQLGGKSFHVFGVKNLNVQTEFNFVRPYTYSHLSSRTNYSQYNQALAHPLGANFYESVSFVNYRWKNFFIETKYMYSKIGLDLPGSNLGSNIFLDYRTHDHDYGNELLQGVLTTLSYKELKVSYLMNPKTNFIIEAGVSDRNYKNIFGNFETRFVYFGIRTALENYYFDF